MLLAAVRDKYGVTEKIEARCGTTIADAAVRRRDPTVPWRKSFCAKLGIVLVLSFHRYLFSRRAAARSARSAARSAKSVA